MLIYSDGGYFYTKSREDMEIIHGAVGECDEYSYDFVDATYEPRHSAIEWLGVREEGESVEDFIWSIKEQVAKARESGRMRLRKRRDGTTVKW